MFTTGSKFLIGSAVLAAVSAIAYGVAQDGVMGTVGLALGGGRAGVPRRHQRLHPRLEHLGRRDLLGRDRTSCRPPAGQQHLADGVRPRRRRPHRRPGHLPGGLHRRCRAAARRRRRVDRRGMGRAGIGRRRVQRRGPQPDRQPARVPAGRRDRHRHHRLRLQPHHAVAVEDQHRRLLLGDGRDHPRPSPSSSRTGPGIKSRAAFGAIAVGVLALVAGGAAAGLDGEREIKEHETTEGLTEEGEEICLSPEEFEADEKASQSVGARAAVAADDHARRRRPAHLRRQRPDRGGCGRTCSRCPGRTPTTSSSSTSPTRTVDCRVDLTVPPATAAEDEEVPYLVVHHAGRAWRQPEHHPHDRRAELRRPRRLLLLRARCRVGPAGTGCAMSNSPIEKASS